ncbi:hypothetical protein PsJ27TS7_15140 [Paenibacillus dendritiformis]
MERKAGKGGGKAKKARKGGKWKEMQGNASKGGRGEESEKWRGRRGEVGKSGGGAIGGGGWYSEILRKSGCWKTPVFCEGVVKVHFPHPNFGS